MFEAAKKYHDSGLSVIPVDAKKVPVGAWSASIKQRVEPNGQFKNCYGIGVVCGAVSGNLECIDIDCKYDLTGKLFTDYCELIKSADENILPKLLVEKTQKGGYHFFYRCKQIQGNTKLASRYTTESEKQAEPHQKVKVLIETRGEGGYVMVYPSPNYTLARGDFSSISEITPQERQVLLDCAKAMNEVYDKPITKPNYEPNDKPNVFEEYNQKADVLGLLQEYGWKVKRQRGEKYLMLRPGGEGMWSADYDESKRLFYVFSTSTEFESGKAFNPSQVLTVLRFKGDYSAASKWLRENGYGGEKITYKRPVKPIEHFNEIIPNTDEVAEYLETVRNGSFQLGLSTGIPKLDEFFRLKPKSLVVINGHDNTGKSTVLWYLAVLSAINHGWTWVIHAAENKTGGVYRKIIEFYTGKQVRGMERKELEEATKWAYKHFTVLSNKETYTYTDLLEITDKLLPRNALLIDPFNSLYRDKLKNENVHDYDYECLGDFRKWINNTGCSVYVNCHAVTEALRKVYPKGHVYESYPMPPSKADTEGGGKFSNRADDFLTIHRMTQHEKEWMWSEIHVRKIKEMETGGRPTFYDSPVKIRMTAGGTGFEDESGYNPLTKKTTPISEPDEDAPF